MTHTPLHRSTVHPRLTSPGRRALLAGLMVGASLLAGAVLAELLLRATGAARGTVFTVTSAQFERVPGIFAPGLDGMVRSVPELSHRVRIDSLGYRGADFPRSKSPGEFRIVFVGDSFVFGDFVEDNETLPAQLASILADRCSGTIRVVNAGLGGSTITEQVEMAARSIAIDPDLVILQFHENDVEDLAGATMWEDLARNRAAKSRLPMSVIYPLVRQTALWHLASRALATHRSASVGEALATREPDDVEAGGGAGGGEDRGEALRETYRAYLAQIRGDLERQRVAFMLTVFPSHLSVYGTRDLNLLPWLDGVIRGLDLEAVSFLEPLVQDGRSSSELYLLPYDGHASAQGYSVAAKALAEAMIASGKLGRSCP